MNEMHLKRQSHLLEAFDYSAIVSETDLRGNITYVNNKFLNISQYSKAELLGKNHSMINSELHDKLFLKEMYRTLKNGKTWNGELKIKSKNGSFYWVNATIYPIKNIRNKVIKFISIFFDITDKKKLESTLTDEIAKSTKLAQVKTEFLSSMSHEIRTPLNGIIGMANLLLESLTKPENIEKLSIIKDNSHNLLALINDILDYSKMEANQINLIKEPLELESLVNNLIQLLNPISISNEIELKYEIKQSVPKWILSDSLRIRQILINLIGNGLKFTKKGRVIIKISSKKVGKNDYKIMFSIQDTGIGISKNDYTKLFNPFSQIDHVSTREYQGTGLGLVICKKLSVLLGGDINVTSKLGVGSKFSFYIITQEHKNTDKTNSIIPHKKKKNSFFNKNLASLYPLSILMVEDNSTNRLVLSNYLKNFGYNDFDISLNGAEAVIANKTNHYDLVLMDCHMPVMDGFDASVKIIEDNLPIVVAVTASACTEECYKAGMTGFLSKPIVIEELKNILINSYNLIHSAYVEDKNGKKILDKKISTHEKKAPFNFDRIINHYQDDILLLALASDFIQAYPSYLTELEEGVREKNKDKIKFNSHTLKNMLSYFFSYKAVNIAKIFEERSQKSDLVDCTELLNKFKKEVFIIENELIELCEKLKRAA